ncbi:FadR/GntR family transcriptional regulator [Aureimonas frigidaquae]|uniref:GntR family transcriptional regulator n=1 Tax=Aureimonas frigidaquae TaxID=424757 RepID=A0A0P0Z243_9HYPH|nr:FadR/GntR family transcriptional regulator [Aureimonas frigidaquae]BAT28008.1 GntR family transcriptional regulator [Aureimonas frigidaquae]
MSDAKQHSIFSGKAVSPSRLADAVSDAIAAALLDGKIQPGDALPPEGEIAREFGVSRPIAREALRQLTSAGLVTTQQGKVARARALSGEPMDRIYGYAVRASIKSLMEANEMRRVLETGIAGLAAERRDARGLSEMREALDRMERALGQAGAFTDADLTFHHGMAMATGNAMIRIQIEGLRSIHREVSEIFTARNARTQKDWQATVQRHRAIYDAIAGGDATLAGQAVRLHYEATDIASLEIAADTGKHGQ